MASATARASIDAAAMPLARTEVRPDSPLEPASESPRQVARRVEESTPNTPAAPAVAPWQQESPGFTVSASQFPIEVAEMPLARTEIRPASPVEPAPDGLVHEDSHPAVARRPDVSVPMDLGTRLSDVARSLDPQESSPAAAVASNLGAVGRGNPELPLAVASEVAPAARMDSPVGGPLRTGPRAADQTVAQPTLARLAQRSAGDDAVQPVPFRGSTSAEVMPLVSPTVSGAQEFSRGVINLNQPLQTFEAWAARPNDQPPGNDVNSSPGSVAEGVVAPVASTRSLPSPLARPSSLASRSAEASAELSWAPRRPTTGAVGQPGRPQRSAADGLGSSEQSSNVFGGPGAAAPPMLRSGGELGRLFATNAGDASPWRGGIPTAAERPGEPAMGPLGRTAQEPWGALGLPSQAFALSGTAWAESGSTPAGPHQSSGRTQSAVSRLADLPLAPMGAVRREPEEAVPSPAAPQPAVGTISTAAPAGPQAAPAPEGEIDRLADRVWQIIRRRLQVERERQRGLP